MKEPLSKKARVQFSMPRIGILPTTLLFEDVKQTLKEVIDKLGKKHNWTTVMIYKFLRESFGEKLLK